MEINYYIIVKEWKSNLSIDEFVIVQLFKRETKICIGLSVDEFQSLMTSCDRRYQAVVDQQSMKQIRINVYLLVLSRFNLSIKSVGYCSSY